MISIIISNNVVEKELDMDRQGFRRTRRWIGDVSQVGDRKLYQTKLNQVAIYKDKLNKIKNASEVSQSRQARASFLERLSNLFSTPRQPASSKT